jgi:tRNA pseudouridine13 synthase
MSDGWRFQSSPDTFEVEEIPAYRPTGDGSHTFLFIEKRSLTTFQAVEKLALVFNRPPAAIGHAGMKDKHATTRQWVSVPDLAPEAASALQDADLRVLEAVRHGNKLKTGHLRGNRFVVTVARPIGDAETDGDAAFAALLARAEELRHTGLPNRYGEQRFGVGADNAAAGVAVLRGERRVRDGKQRRLLVSAAQAAVFNGVLALRRERGLLRKVLAGDVLQKTETHGVFISEDGDADQRRLDDGELVTTGPLPGSWAKMPPEGTEAAALEGAAFDQLGAPFSLFQQAGKDLPGTRRPLLVPVTDLLVTRGPTSGTARLTFSLPAGSYATVLLAALDIDVA